MGTYVIRMPDIGEGIAEVELVEWHVKPGDDVVEDQDLADVMTDKASVEIPSPVHGKVIALTGKPGDVIAVGTELIRIEIEGPGNVDGSRSAAQPASAERASGSASEPQIAADSRRNVVAAPAAPATPRNGAQNSQDRSDNAAAERDASRGAAPASAKPAPARPEHHDVESAAPSPVALRAGERPIASPAVRRRAWDMGIELRYVRGSGPAGRIVHADLDAYAARGAQHEPHGARASYAERHDEEIVPVIGLRRKIAQKMQESKRRIPHFTYVEEVDVTELESLRARLNTTWAAERGRLTLIPFLMRAIVRAVPAFPEINARFDDEGGNLTRFGAVHIGIATQTANGLMVPVVRHAEARDLWSCAVEVARLAEAARTSAIARDDLSGSTITITSLGPLGGIVTTPVINHPEVAIVGVNRIVERPVMRSGAVIPRSIMNLSSSFDHRIVDGLRAAEFVQALRAYLESPATLFID